MAIAFVIPSIFTVRRQVTIIRRTTPSCSLTAPSEAVAAAKGPCLSPPLKHFLHVDDFTPEQLERVLTTARKIKEQNLLNDASYQPLLNKAMSMVFAKPSARTRVSFETAMYKLGGHALVLGPEVGVNTREAAKDVARVLSGMTDVIMARLFAHRDVLEMAEVASVPVINGLTDYNHPCQIVADALTIVECCGKLKGVRVVYVGDGNNIVHSWMELAAIADIDFICCCPRGFEPDMELMERANGQGRGRVRVCHEVGEAVVGADFVYTDVWASMGQKEETEDRERAFSGYQVNADVMRKSGGGRFLHCLPAERGRECTDEVMEAEYSEVFRQSENRMHAQVAIVLECLGIAAEV